MYYARISLLPLLSAAAGCARVTNTGRSSSYGCNPARSVSTPTGDFLWVM